MKNNFKLIHLKPHIFFRNGKWRFQPCYAKDWGEKKDDFAAFIAWKAKRNNPAAVLDRSLTKGET